MLNEEFCKKVLLQFVTENGYLNLAKEQFTKEEYDKIVEAMIYVIDQKYIDDTGYQKLFSGEYAFTTFERKLGVSNKINLMSLLTDSGKKFLEIN